MREEGGINMGQALSSKDRLTSPPKLDCPFVPNIFFKQQHFPVVLFKVCPDGLKPSKQ